MKKRTLLTLLAAALIAVQPMSVLAAGPSAGTNISSGSSSGGSSSSSSSKASATNNGTSTSTSDGQSLNTNGAGSQTENVKAVFAVGKAETAGLPETVVSSINSINSGADLAEATGNPAAAGYSALTKTAAVVLQDTAAGGVAEKEATVTLYVPNLIEGLQNVKVLYYENATGLWKLVDPTMINFENHTISFTMFGSGTVTVVHG